MIREKNFSHLMDRRRKRKRIEHSSRRQSYDRESMGAGNYGNFMKLLQEEKLVRPHEYLDKTIDSDITREETTIHDLESKFGLLSSKKNRDQLKKEFVNDGLEGK